MGAKLKTGLWFILLLALGIGGRLVPHLPNFTPTLAIALFAGAVLPGPLALITPLLSLFLGDLTIGFHDEVWVVYLSLLPLIWFGSRGSNFLTQAICGSVFFFATTNLAVWWSSGMYAHTAFGLETCFVLAVPFFLNSLAATAIYLYGLRLGERLVTLIPARAIN